MKKLFSRLPKKLMAVAIVAAIVFGVTTSGTALIGGDREVRPYTPGNTPGFNHVTFNSFTGVPNIGDERNFVTGKISQAPGGFYDPMNQVRAGDEILVRVYVHNNADSGLNASGQGVAKNTRVRVSIPNALSQDQKIHGFVSADNATPAVIEDTLSVNGEYPFQFDYVEGSARIKTNFMDAALSDSITTSGVLIGDDKLDGNVNGCFEYVGLVTFKVKVKAPSYSLDKKVRVSGTDNYTENVEVEPGQKVDFVLNFKNVGSTNLQHVVLGDKLPAGFTYVPGTTEWYSYHTGYKWTKVANENLFDGGIDVGAYGPNSSVFIRFTAVANDIECGVKKLINTGYAKPKSHGAIEDKASVVVTNDKECEEPETPKYSCDLVTVSKLGDRKIRVTTKVTAAGGAAFKNISLNYGDGSEVKVTDQLVNEHEYAKDGTYKISVSATFTVDGKDKTVTSEACASTVTFSSEVENCPIPGKEHLPKDSEECVETPEELPNTGAEGIIALFAVVTLAAAGAHNVLARRNM